MRKLTKATPPHTISERGTALTRSYVEAPHKQKPSPWRAADIVSRLHEETLHKCAYCESKIAAVAWDHVEHIAPKSRFPELVLDWDNLTVACPRCNQYKGDYWTAETPLLNPYVDNPQECLMFEHGILLPQPGDERARITVLQLRLHRPDLKERREAALAQMVSLVHDWGRAPDDLKPAIEELVLEAVDASVEYVSFRRAYLDRAGFDWRAKLSA